MVTLRQLPSSRVICVEFALSAQVVGMLDLLTEVSPNNPMGGAHLRVFSHLFRHSVFWFCLLSSFGVFVLLSGNANAHLYTEVDKQ